MTVERELRWITEVFAGFCENEPRLSVENIYNGNQSPYRWLSRTDSPVTYVGTISLSGRDVLEMQPMSETEKRAFLFSKFEAEIIPVMQHP